MKFLWEMEKDCKFIFFLKKKDKYLNWLENMDD